MDTSADSSVWRQCVCLATMLATFLIRLALGSAIAARLAATPERAWLGFAVAQMAIAALSLAAFAAVDRLPALAEEFAASGKGFLVSGVILGGSTLLPGAVAMGATFPFTVRILARNANDAARASGRVFAWNTFGAIIGALSAGYVVLPALRFASMPAAVGAISLALALIAALIGRPRRRLFALLAIAGLPGTGRCPTRDAGGGIALQSPLFEAASWRDRLLRCRQRCNGAAGKAYLLAAPHQWPAGVGN